MLKATHYRLQFSNLPRPCKMAIASDLHGAAYDRVISLLRESKPDYILIPGDIMSDTELCCETSVGYGFLCACAAIAPTVYSLGNHEIACYHKGNPWRHPTPVFPDEECISRIRACGVMYLDNDCVALDGFTFCGLTSGINGKKNAPDEKALERFSDCKGFRVLLCHHPEYFAPYIQKTDIELTVSGHAHGGQWRIFGRGVYAPGQGLFPKYTSGIWNNRLVISRGLANHSHIPRIFNAPELILLDLED